MMKVRIEQVLDRHERLTGGGCGKGRVHVVGSHVAVGRGGAVDCSVTAQCYTGSDKRIK